MTELHGFELIREEHVAEVNGTVSLYRHIKTGAQVLSVVNDDENKVFGINFFTPPPDHTGMTHIMEHSVLLGSQKYPVKEPFVELIKSSLATFLNAFTYPEKTCYPVATTNLKDLYNLIDVYIDCTLHPRLTPENLEQEGWHYELDAEDGEMVYKGVVFNEMKGAFSDPEGVLGRYTQHSLFPDHIYGLESGGDPKYIPDLQYDNFKRYHETYYHPSNAMIWFYGDAPAEERLRYLNDQLSGFEAQQIDRNIAPQPDFTEPRRLMIPYDAGDEEGTGKRGFVSVNWKMPAVGNGETELALSILDYILLGSPASPLKKALIDSGLGEGLTRSGLESDISPMAFFVGLKGINPDDGDKVEALILQTLQELADRGIETEMIEAAMNTIEFRLREMNTGGYPRGIAYMVGVLNHWIHGSDPIDALKFEADLAAIKAKLAAGEKLFESLIQEHFLNNPHRTTVLLKPDPDVADEAEAAEKDRLDQTRAAMNTDQVQQVIAETAKLKEMQTLPDSPEALATIPVLKLEDLNRQHRPIPVEESQIGGVRTLTHDLFTNNILYLDLAFDLHTLNASQLPYLSIFPTLLTEMGTSKEDFVKLSQRIGRKTGGINVSVLNTAIKDSTDSASYLVVRAKATVPQTADMLDLLRDILLDADLSNKDRFKQIVLEAKAEQEASLIPAGHMVAARRLRAKFHEAHWADETIKGVTGLQFIRELAGRVDTDWDNIHRELQAIRSALLSRGNLIVNATVDNANLNTIRPMLETFVNALPNASVNRVKWSEAMQAATKRTGEGLTIPAQVNYVAKGGNLFQNGYERDGSVLAISNFLSMVYLWERVRVKGGAYGGFFNADTRSGTVAYVSYRDPNLLETLDTYDEVPGWLKEVELPQDELERLVIGGVGELEQYQLPDAKGYTSLVRTLTGESDADLQTLRDEVFDTTADDFRSMAQLLDRVKEASGVVVVGSADAIQQANEQRPGLLEVTRLM